MRLEGQMRGGFYPCPIAAIDAAMKRVKRPEGLACSLLDPCAGEGEAVARIAEVLGIEATMVLAAELEAGRSLKLAERLPKARVLQRCDFTAVEASGNSLSMAWVNPPFDDEIGGGARVELTFLRRVLPMMAKGGLLVLVCPEHVLSGWDVKEHILAYYERPCVIAFPQDCRRFKEVVLFAVRHGGTKKANVSEWNYLLYENRDATYRLVEAAGPRRWQKGGLSEEEQLECVAKSPLLTLLQPPAPLPPPRPPLELSKGQLALMLAGGMLNGAIQREGEPPILVKATAYKEEYVSSEDEEIRGSGDSEQVVTVRVTSERIKLKVRVLTQQGAIKDLV